MAPSAVALVAAGAAYATARSDAAKVTKVAIAVAREGRATTAGTSRATTAPRRPPPPSAPKFQAVTNIGYDKTDVVLRQLAQGGANFIVAHASGYDTIAAAARAAVQGADDRPTTSRRT